ncbi:MAG: molybdate ABC transporter substrate-binding protein [Nitrospinota bacterium]|nr:molybdate ABC transporter substrate-binding protein [Nitrospinota bacterium]
MSPRQKVSTFFFLFLFQAFPLHADSVLIAAASNVQYVFEKLTREFHLAHPEVQVKVSFGSSGNFHSQIIHGAPFDIFFSADLSYPQKLEKAGFAAPGYRTRPYAFGKIVIWWANDADLEEPRRTFKALADPNTRKIAIANPRHAPYGKAALESMKHFSVYDQVKDKLVIGENISQTAQFADSGAAQAGILAFSLIAGGRMKNPGIYWEIPSDSHQPIVQGFLILKNGKNQHAAKAFADFIMSPHGQNSLKRHGYEVPAAIEKTETSNP